MLTESRISLKKLKGVPQTLLIPLRARYLETKRDDGVISDPKSVEIIDSIDHDFSAADLPWDCQIMISARTLILDAAAKKFLRDNPDGVVVNLGCGLDTRVNRVDNGRMLWYDLDLSECISLRRSFFQETDRYKFIAKSVLDFSWVNDIVKNRKMLFIAEGLLMYFSEDDVKSIISTIKNNFSDSELVFEGHSLLLAKSWHKNPHIKNAYSHFKWGVTTGRSMEKWGDGIRFLKEWLFLDQHPKRWRWLRFLRYVPRLRKVMKIVHLRFNSALN